MWPQGVMRVGVRVMRVMTHEGERFIIIMTDVLDHNNTQYIYIYIHTQKP